MNLRFLFFLFLIFTPIAAFTQQLNYAQGELLVRLSPDSKIDHIIQRCQSVQRSPTPFSYKQLIPNLNIWQISFDFTQVDQRSLKQDLWLQEAVQQVQYNQFVQDRAVPDDPLFDDQWHHVNSLLNGSPNADLDSDLAWDIATGGLTPFGDTIVIAVIDNGIGLEHEDLVNQRWVNHAEIPNNGIDDDANGYIDDYLGYNSLEDNGDIAGGDHGSSVAGIIAAQGNNQIGVTGINWDAKLMVIKNNFNTTEANVLASYGYAYNMRRAYNLSNGNEGAFVVATNSSWGRDFGQPESAPLWCDFYDELGAQGIVNCAATSNMDINVDAEGDLPTACTSPYLIAVTNVNAFGEKVNDAGYGSESIDLGAFGDGVFTTNENSYGVFNGTSAACPMATGLVGLLYAAPCANLTSIAKDNPQDAADFVIDYLQSGVKENLSLQEITKSGGQVNVYNSLIQMMDDCAECSLPSGFSSEANPQQRQIFNWTAFNSSLAVNIQYRVKGDSSFNTILNVEPPFTLDGLLPCTDYVYQLESICGDTTSSYTELSEFTTTGCCENPTSFTLELQAEDQLFIVWPSVALVEAYTYRYRAIADENWSTTDTISNNFADLTSLQTCTDYIFQVKAICSGVPELEWSEFFARTTGCGICAEGTYCEVSGMSTASEWIESIKLHTTNLKTGNNQGYFSHESSNIVLSIDGEYALIVTPGYSNQALPEQVNVWLDLNQNSIFEANELLLRSPVIKQPWEARLKIPSGTNTGQTKMRITQNWVTDESNPMQIPACGEIAFGEVEDLCVTISEQQNPCTDSVDDLMIVSTDLSSAILTWSEVGDASEYLLQYREFGEAQYDSLYTTQNQVIINGLEVCLLHEVMVTSLCNGFPSAPSLPILFDTECNPLDDVAELYAPTYTVLQNPFHDEVHVQFDDALQTQTVQLFTIDGRLISPLQTSVATDQLHIRQLGNLSPGIYILRVQTSVGMIIIKLVKA